MMEIWLYLFQLYFKCKYLLICDNELDNWKGIEYSYHQQIPISIEKTKEKTQKFQDNNSLTLNRSIEEYYIWHGQNKLSLKTKLIRSGLGSSSIVEEKGQTMGETAKNGLGAERGPLTLSRLPLSWLGQLIFSRLFPHCGAWFQAD